MTTETLLTETEIGNLMVGGDISNFDKGVTLFSFTYDEMIGAARAIEQAALQSPEVQAWKKDAGRYQATRAAMLNSEDDLPKRMSDYALENFANPHNPTPDEIDEAYDAAMEKQ